MTVLIDYTQVVVAGALAFGPDFDKGKDTEKAVNILRHAVLTTLLNYKEKFTSDYGNLVICADGSNNWRKTYFPYYKINRKKGREESTTDWSLIFEFASRFLSDLTEVFPFKVIRHDRAEGDDVIGVLTKYITEHECEQEGLFQSAPKILVISSDGDYKQLHKYKNVRQWNPIMKKYVEKPEPDFLFEKCIKGDSGDGVPNALSPDDWFVNGEGRAKPITKKVIDRFKSGDINEQEKRNFERNKVLVDFDCIPIDIQQEIIELYNQSTPVNDLNLVMNYLIKNRMRILLESLQQFKV
jgi:hypothetical protein